MCIYRYISNVHRPNYRIIYYLYTKIVQINGKLRTGSLGPTKSRGGGGVGEEEEAQTDKINM